MTAINVFVYDLDKREWTKQHLGNVLPRIMVTDDDGNEFVIEVLKREENGIGINLREGYISVRPQSANYIQVKRGEY